MVSDRLRAGSQVMLGQELVTESRGEVDFRPDFYHRWANGDKSQVGEWPHTDWLDATAGIFPNSYCFIVVRIASPAVR